MIDYEIIVYHIKKKNNKKEHVLFDLLKKKFD